MQVKKHQLEQDMEQQTGSKLGKEYGILSPCLFNLHSEYVMKKTGLDESQAGIKIAGRNINNLRYEDDTTLMAENEEELRGSFMRVKQESWLKIQHLKNEELGIWSHHFTSSRRGKSGNSDRFSFVDLQNHCQWWLQPWNWKDTFSLEEKLWQT